MFAWAVVSDSRRHGPDSDDGSQGQAEALVPLIQGVGADAGVGPLRSRR